MKRWLGPALAGILIGCLPALPITTRMDIIPTILEPDTCSALGCRNEDYQITFLAMTNGSKGIEFVIQNTGKNPLLILWDESAYIDLYGQSSRIIHHGVRFSERDAPQAPSTIAPGTSFREKAIPAANVNYISANTGWQLRPLFYSGTGIYSLPIENPQTMTKLVQGKRIGLYLMIKVGEEKQPQKFTLQLEVKERPGLRPAASASPHP